jgi:hypothetical protein
VGARLLLRAAELSSFKVSFFRPSANKQQQQQTLKVGLKVRPTEQREIELENYDHHKLLSLALTRGNYDNRKLCYNCHKLEHDEPWLDRNTKESRLYGRERISKVMCVHACFTILAH